MARLSLSSVEVFSLLARLGCFLQALSLAHTGRHHRESLLTSGTLIIHDTGACG